jgi:beta-N-acetylhexosaminidase
MISPDRTTDDLDSKIGQMLIVGFRGLELQEDHPIVQDIRERSIGGVILFDHDTLTHSPSRNIQSAEQVKRLTVLLQELASCPLFIAIDQEGGKVNRLKERFGFPSTVSAQYLGHLNQLNVTSKYADMTAVTLADLGINVNFAPVVDLNTNPQNPIIGKVERSFSDDPDIVTAHALEWIQAHHKHHVLCVLKHFPGHGSSSADSHLGWVDVTDTWSSEELIPYSNIIRVGDCDMVMTAHIFNAKLDPDLPATLSRAIITGILRNQLNYDGVVVSDDMQMKAITSQYSFEVAIQSTIEAGVDLLIYGNNSGYEENIAAKASTTIKKLVLDGIITRDRIDQSYQRIRRLKECLERIEH